jgi:hypothetical protein
MIRREQLSIQIDRLVDVYGDKSFSEQREHLIWQAVEGLEYAQVIKMVDVFISEMRMAPLPNDFSLAAKLYTRNKNHFALGEEQPHETAKCNDCLDSGFVNLSRQEPHEEWAKWANGSAPCHCARGEQLIAAGKRQKSPTHFGPQFSDAWRNSYSIQRPVRRTLRVVDDGNNDDGGAA